MEHGSTSNQSGAGDPGEGGEEDSEDVAVRVGPLDGGFYVADDGPGLSKDESNRAFEGGYSTKQDGTGFGLAIVSRIVEAHERDVSTATRQSGGTRFEVSGVVTEPGNQAASDG